MRSILLMNHKNRHRIRQNHGASLESKPARPRCEFPAYNPMDLALRLEMSHDYKITEGPAEPQ